MIRIALGLPLIVAATVLLAVVVHAALAVTQTAGSTQNAISLGKPVRIVSTGAGDGVPHMFWAYSAPQNSRYGLLCVQREHPAATDDAIYATSDGGTTWHKTKVDNSGYRVAEESCGYGSAGRAYFATGVWAVSPRGDNLPRVLHLFHSDNYGFTWNAPSRRPFVDWTLVAADQFDVDNRRVYVFGHEEVDRPYGRIWSTTPVVLSSTDGGRSFSKATPRLPHGPIVKYSYPTGSIVLPDGTIIAVFPAGLKGSKTYDGAVILVSVSKSGRIGESVLYSGWAWAGFPSIALDANAHSAFQRRIYVAWLGGNARVATIYLSTSDNMGKTWKTHPTALSGVWGSMKHPACWQMRYAEEKTMSLGEPSIAVNGDGVLGLAWPENDGASTHFAFSRDGGQTFVDQGAVAACSPISALTVLNNSVELIPNQAFLSAKIPGLTKFGFTIQFVVKFGSEVKLTADRSRLFHVFWEQPAADGQNLWTRSIGVGTYRASESADRRVVAPLTTTPNPIMAPRTYTEIFAQPTSGAVVPRGLRDVSRQIGLKLIDSTYDASSQNLTATIAVCNFGNSVVMRPLSLQVAALTSELANAQIAAPNGSLGKGSSWDVSAMIPLEGLQPGKTSRPFQVRFHLTHFHFPRLAQDEPRAVSVSLRAYAK